MQPGSGRHLYGRGFLGLIPLIGAFVGIGLIILGAAKYRNRNLVLIGFAALIPTLLVYGFLYFDNFTPSGKNRWTVFCRPNLNQLVKNIEFYKREYKVYPDSLEELTTDQEFLSIVDPVQAFTKSAYGNKYFYRKQGTKYILFAMGIDGIPFTGDDIFPAAKYFDSTLTGLVRPNK